MKNVWVAVGLLIAVGCSSSQRETWDVAAHRQPCVGLAEQLCLVVKRPSSSMPGTYYSEIAGLTPQWGHEYTVDVDITPVSPVPADGSSERVNLAAIRRDAPVPAGTTFQFDMFAGRPDRYLSMTAAEAGQLSDGTPFTCTPGSDVCDQIAARLADGTPFAITFAYGPDSLSALSVEDSNGPG